MEEVGDNDWVGSELVSMTVGVICVDIWRSVLRGSGAETVGGKLEMRGAVQVELSTLFAVWPGFVSTKGG